MQYIPTLNYMCVRNNRKLCQREIIDLCDEPVSRKSLGKHFYERLDSSTLSRLLFEMERIGVLEHNKESVWQVGASVKYNGSGLPFALFQWTAFAQRFYVYSVHSISAAIVLSLLKDNSTKSAALQQLSHQIPAGRFGRFPRSPPATPVSAHGCRPFCEKPIPGLIHTNYH
jgi:hypothetical protein